MVWRETQRAREKGKPVIVSMGSVAGSGGYWISMGADAIVAQPSTITGSIGVIFQKFNAEGFLETLNGMIVGFAPAQAIGEKLNIDYLKSNINLTNTRNWFTVKNGTLSLEEYDTKLKDIAMKIGGMCSVRSGN